MWRRYLMWFAHDHVDLRYAEIQSILSMYNIPMKFIEDPSDTRPYWVVELPDEESALKVASRSISLRNLIELWSRGNTEEQLHSNMRRAMENHTQSWVMLKDWEFVGGSHNEACPSSLIDSCCMEEKSYKVQVETFGNHLSMAEKVAKIETFDYLPMRGPVNLKNPETMLMFLEVYTDFPNCNNIPDKPLELFLGRWVADGQRHRIKKLSLKSRKFIGNTSMDSQLSLLMANQARVRPGHLVMDPFVGSGSLLVAAAEFGGYVWGSDIDFMMLHGRTRPTRVKQKVRATDESIKSNMRQYGVAHRYLDVVVSDFALPLLRDEVKFDSIITDPPYGVREPTERIGIERENYSLREEHLANHIPSKVDYDLQHIYRDLLNFAAKHLSIGGRLVVWYPIVRDDYQEKALPSHPCFKLAANSEQVLSALTSRRLLTYEKTCTAHHRHTDLDLDIHHPVSSFREKFFTSGDMTKKERKERCSPRRHRERSLDLD